MARCTLMRRCGSGDFEGVPMTIVDRDITNELDGTLVLLLGALLARRDLPSQFVNAPWNDVLGTLGRHRMRAALTATPGVPAQRYRLAQGLCDQFPGASVCEDHVFPLHAWKTPLLSIAEHEKWHFDVMGLASLRAFVLRHYVTVQVPVPLHAKLLRNRMPPGWQYGHESSMWERYRTQEVIDFVGRALRIPGEVDADFDSISL